MGCGHTIWADLDRISRLKHMGVVAVNNMILHYKDRVHHGVSMHPEEPNLWRALRPMYRCEESHVTTHSYRRHEKKGLYSECDYLWDIEGSKGGTSSILATMIALALGYDRVILAGVPLDNGGHFYDPPGTNCRFDSDFLKMEWVKASETWFRGRVRSMSGWTRTLLGVPDEGWTWKI
jgi:hypothetical protein